MPFLFVAEMKAKSRKTEALCLHTKNPHKEFREGKYCFFFHIRMLEGNRNREKFPYIGHCPSEKAIQRDSLVVI